MESATSYFKTVFRIGLGDYISKYIITYARMFKTARSCRAIFYLDILDNSTMFF